MARLFAKELHIYEDRENKRHWWIPAGEWREVPDDIALFLVAAHPTKLSILVEEEQKYPTTQIEAPPVDRQMRAKRTKVA